MDPDVRERIRLSQLSIKTRIETVIVSNHPFLLFLFESAIH